MKAKINGIELEGTPEEIIEFKRILNEQETKDYFKIPVQIQRDPWANIKSDEKLGTGNLEARWEVTRENMVII